MHIVDKDAKGSIDGMQKILLLVWGYLNGNSYQNWSLHADTNYIVQNSARILRCLLDISFR